MLRRLVLAFLLCQLCAQGVISQDNPVIPPDTTTVEPPPPTTEKPTDPPKPPTTTEKPTDPPKTTTSGPVTTTPKPVVPAFPANTGNWNYTDSVKNVTCIVLTGALEIDILLADNKTHEKVDVPGGAAVSGGWCNETRQSITLIWDLVDNGTTYENNLSFTFVLNKTAGVGSGIGGPITPNNYALTEVTGIAYYVNKDKNNTLENKILELNDFYAYQTTQNHSYRCMSEESLKSKDGIVHLKLARLQMQAFHASKDSNFGTVTTCTLDGNVADIVPIAVGASLAGLVAIVLVAYLIGRRRSRARGYQSV